MDVKIGGGLPRPRVACLLGLVALVATPAVGQGPPRPTREYVYAGSRLLAVSGPLPTVLATEAVSPVDENTGAVRLAVSLRTADGGPLAAGASVAYQTMAGTAKPGEDFVVSSGRLAFPAGTPDGTPAVVEVVLVDDARHEATETFRVELLTPVGLAIGTERFDVEIRDDDPPPVVNVLSTRVPEGNAGTVPAVLTVALSRVSGLDATVDYATENGTAIAGSDYVSTSGTVMVPAGQSAQTIAIAVKGDSALEPDESFTVRFSSPAHATLEVGEATVTIVADDLPRVSVSPTRGTEGLPLVPWIEPGFTTFKVTLDGWVFPASVEYRTEDDTATAGQDYVGTSGTLFFESAQQFFHAVRVPILDDTLTEGREIFRLVLHSPTGAVLGTAVANASIRDDESPPTPDDLMPDELDAEPLPPGGESSPPPDADASGGVW